MYKFKTDSKLKTYVASKQRPLLDNFSYYHLKYTFSDLCYDERMTHLKNPDIVMCTPELETIINRRVFSMTEFDKVFGPYVELTKEWNVSKTLLKPKDSPTRPVFDKYRAAVYDDPSTKFDMSYNLETMLAILPDFPDDQYIYSYQSILLYVLQYIDTYKEQLIDPRSPDIVIVQGDPLGNFKVKAFHHSNLHTLIKKHISVTL
jgi:hypothetical protein